MLRDHELVVELAEREVGPRDVGNQREQDSAARLLASPRTRAFAASLSRRIRPQMSSSQPKLTLASQRFVVAVLFGSEEDRVAAAGKAAADVDLREELRAGDARVRPELVDAPGRDPDVVVGAERLVDQLLEDRVAEDVPPGLIGERRRRRRRALNLAVLVGNGEGRPLVVGADGASARTGRGAARTRARASAAHVSALHRRRRGVRAAGVPGDGPGSASGTFAACPCPRSSRPARRAPG